MLDLKFSRRAGDAPRDGAGSARDHQPADVVRELEDDPTGYSPELWKQLAHLDLIGPSRSPRSTAARA